MNRQVMDESTSGAKMTEHNGDTYMNILSDQTANKAAQQPKTTLLPEKAFLTTPTTSLQESANPVSYSSSPSNTLPNQNNLSYPEMMTRDSHPRGVEYSGLVTRAHSLQMLQELL